MIALKPSPLTASLSLNARLQAATEALLKTRDQVVEALDQHLNELDTLRRALNSTEKPQQPVAHLDGLPTGTQAPAPAHPSQINFERHTPAPVSPSPLMTQVLWPSKQQEQPATPMRTPAPQAMAPRPNPAPASSPLVAYTSLPNGGTLQNTVDPDLEKATLEELNAALAYAFSHVSHARSAPNGYSSPL